MPRRLTSRLPRALLAPLLGAVLLLRLGLAATFTSLTAPPGAVDGTAPAAVPAPQPSRAAVTAPRTVTLHWAVPEPRLAGGQVERPLIRGVLPLTLSAEEIAAVRKTGSLDTVRPALARVYAQVEARTPRDVRFTPSGTAWVAQARTGWTVDRATSEEALLAALRAGEARSPLSLRLRAPARSVRWAAGMRLGVLGSGGSSFAGSPAFRVHNIRTGAARVNGAWVEAGATFSFNALVGRISAATGFQPGYVVVGNTLRTEDGGGICQVSTTVFRAALRAGLPVTERHAHSYQVAYYGAPGLDATVYAPSKDLRWRNDTGAPVLVQAAWDTEAERLTVSLFGRADGRHVQVREAVVRGRTPAGEPGFVLDRSLPPGGARRLDMPAAGMTASVVTVVTWPGGRQRAARFDSRYRPWGGVFAVAPGSEHLR